MMTVASLFCGCGGSDIGMAGGFSYLGKYYPALPFETMFAIDNDRYAVETYNANIACKAQCADIETLRTTDIPDIDIVIGGFPCQSFSTVNPTKNPLDRRAHLYEDMAKILEEKQPRCFIAENVKGLLVLQGGTLFEKVRRRFERCGYTVTCALLNAADFGIPQKRERVFMVGIRHDLSQEFHFPDPTHGTHAASGQPWAGLQQVIDTLAIDDQKYYFSKKAIRGMKKAKNNMKRGLAQNLAEPCLTITSHLAKVSINSRDPVLLVDAATESFRRFTPREAARIQSFPENFVFPVSETQAYRQIGNAIPPVLMWHLCDALVRQLLIQKAVTDSSALSLELQPRNPSARMPEYRVDAVGVGRSTRKRQR